MMERIRKRLHIKAVCFKGKLQTRISKQPGSECIQSNAALRCRVWLLLSHSFFRNVKQKMLIRYSAQQSCLSLNAARCKHWNKSLQSRHQNRRENSPPHPLPACQPIMKWTSPVRHCLLFLRIKMTVNLNKPRFVLIYSIQRVSHPH